MLKNIEIKNMSSNEILVAGKYESVRDCLEKNRGADLEGAYLWGANLRGANLEGANLRGAYLWGANLWGANLRGAKNYVSSHDFWLEIIRRQKVETFTEKEWAIIGQIFTHRLCWDSIEKRFGKNAMPIFNKLAKEGFDEWHKKYEEVLGGTHI